MTQVFAKRFWGFDPLRWPIISFGLEGSRDALIKVSKPGDLLVLVGTQTPPTEPHEQGRLLGIAEIGRLPVDSLDVLDPVNIRSIDHDADGAFKWPKALPMLRAWRFTPQPLLTDILQRQLPQPARTMAVLLDDVDAAAVLGLPREIVEFPEVAIVKRHRELSDALRKTGPTTGPTPGSWSGVVERDVSGPAMTYVFRFGKRNIWKVGQAQDLLARLSEVNKHVPVESLGENWALFLKQKWPTSMAAYEMEQRVLRLLQSARTEGERVSCTDDQITAAWITAMTVQ